MLIFQDDNFTEISRALSSEKAVIVGVPTLDSRSVAHEHYLNSRFRVVAHYPIMRSADGGISAIISAKGKVLRSADHFEEGACVIVADVPLEHGGSWLGVWGHWLMILVSATLLMTSLLRGGGSKAKERINGNGNPK